MNRDTLFLTLVAFIVFGFCVEVALYNNVEHDYKLNSAVSPIFGASNTGEGNRRPIPVGLPEHLMTHVPILPLFDSVSDAEDHIASLMAGRPSMVGVVAVLQKFLSALHDSNMEVIKTEADSETMLDNHFRITEKFIKPFDDLYAGKHIFPVREDGSIFISVAAFREFYLLETLVSAFKNAKNPEKVFIGAVVQNCFGKPLEDGTVDTSGKPCFTGSQYAGTKNGKDIRKVNDAPVDKNGIEAFCALPDYEQYCKSGQIRVLYMHHIDGQGPSMARYYASKLWGGENFFMQIDSHLRFAHEWDAKYIVEAKLTLNYPKSVLSAYPPGFEQVRFIPSYMGIDNTKIDNNTVIESPGCRLCGCGSPKGNNNPIILITQTQSYDRNEERLLQQPFLGAGLVFAHGDFLKDVPYDPYLPWTFMGEEILLSMRAWTNGWNIYAPRKNLIIHQYRPVKLGLPKFYASIGRTFKHVKNGWLQRHTIRRIKHLCGYPLHSLEHLTAENQTMLLADIDVYSLGDTRSLEDYMKFAQITVNHTNGNLACSKRIDWCLDGERA